MSPDTVARNARGNAIAIEASSSISITFVVFFSVYLLLGPVTQLVQIINLPFHVKIGFSEENILDPDMGWFRADELAIAWADMTCLVTGILFVVGALSGGWHSWCIPCGFYTCAIWFYIMLLALVRWPLLESAGFGTVGEGQKGFYNAYASAYVLFGLYGMVYLWGRREPRNEGQSLSGAESTSLLYGTDAGDTK